MLDVSIPSQAFKPSHLVPGLPSANRQLEDLVVNAVGASVEALVGSAVGNAMVGVGAPLVVATHLSTGTSLH
jgi:hypothetical protein